MNKERGWHALAGWGGSKTTRLTLRSVQTRPRNTEETTPDLYHCIVLFNYLLAAWLVACWRLWRKAGSGAGTARGKPRYSSLMGRGGRGHNTLPLTNTAGALREVTPVDQWWSHTEQCNACVTVTPPRKNDPIFTISYILPPCATVPVTVKVISIERDLETLCVYLSVKTGGVKPRPKHEGNVPYGSLKFLPEDVSGLKQVIVQTETSQVVVPWPVNASPTSS